MTAIERAAIATVGMAHANKPTKEQVRAVMAQHLKDKALPSLDEYRRQMGMPMLPNNKSAECAR